MKNLIIGLFSLSLVLSNQNANAQNVNTSTSEVSFEVSNMKFRTVTGTFSGMKGIFNFNESNLSSSNIDICIKAATVDTKNQKRDDHLKTADFFDVAKYPEICFVSTSIVKTSTGYTAEGKLSMHGITKKVSIPLSYNNGKIEASLEVNRLDYKVGEDYGSFMVGEKIKIKITAFTN